MKNKSTIYRTKICRLITSRRRRYILHFVCDLNKISDVYKNKNTYKGAWADQICILFGNVTQHMDAISNVIAKFSTKEPCVFFVTVILTLIRAIFF